MWFVSTCLEVGTEIMKLKLKFIINNLSGVQILGATILESVV